MATLSTERLYLRPFAIEDVDALHAFAIDPEIRRALFENQILPRERIVDFIQNNMQSFRERSYGLFAIEIKDQHVGLVGYCGVRNFVDSDQVELRYSILPGYWGEGYASEAATEVLRFGFQDLAIDRIIAHTDTPNQRAVRVLQRLGMTFDERKEFDGLDSVFYAMTATEFEQR